MAGSTFAVVQARMGSTRLPGKSLADLAGRPLLWHVLRRLQRCRELDGIALATTRKPEDDALAELARGMGVEVFRGSEHDVLDRYYQAAATLGLDTVVRVPADNPVIEPEEIDRIIRYHRKGESDFSSNLSPFQDNGYPDGLGAEVFSFEKLREVWTLAKEPRNREHPHTFFYEHPERYRVRTIPCPAEFRRPELKLDVNTPEDLAYVRAIYEYWYPRKRDFHITDIIVWHDTVHSPRCS